MLKIICLIVGCFILLPLSVQGFDCNKPDFGAPIEELNKDGHFVKYMEKGGISYYRYSGPCRMDMDRHDGSTIAFAFIQGRLYARIVAIPEKEGQSEDIRDRMEKNVSKHVGTQPYSMKLDGDWWVYQWFDEKNSLKYKVKVHRKTNEGKSVCYYEPLRAQLKTMDEAADPMTMGD